MEKDDKLRHIFRPATNADAPAIRELVFSALAEYGLDVTHEPTDNDLQDIESAYFHNGGAFYVLGDDHGAIVGSFALYPMDEGTCQLRRMALRPDYRGRGLGRQMMQAAIENAKCLGYKRITLETAIVLKEAIGLYESFGFKPFEPDKLVHRCDQAYELLL